MTPIEWIQANYGFIVIIVVVIIILFNKQIIKYFRKSKKESVDETLSELSTPGPLFSPEEAGLFDMPTKDTLSNFYEQKKIAQKQIIEIRKDGKKLINEEKKFAFEYTQKKNEYNNQRKQLGMKYISWVNQLKAIDSMINNQIDIEREFDKIKNNGGKANG